MSHPLNFCHACDRMQKGCRGPCACLADPKGRDIIEVAETGDCPLGKFTQPSALATVAHGIVGIVKAVTHLGRAPDAVIESRQRICGTCDQVTLVAGLVSACKVCGCGLPFKTVNASESCPLGKWTAHLLNE